MHWNEPQRPLDTFAVSIASVRIAQSFIRLADLILVTTHCDVHSPHTELGERVQRIQLLQSGRLLKFKSLEDSPGETGLVRVQRERSKAACIRCALFASSNFFDSDVLPFFTQFPFQNKNIIRLRYVSRDAQNGIQCSACKKHRYALWQFYVVCSKPYGVLSFFWNESLRKPVVV